MEGLRDDTIDRLAVQARPPSGARSVLLDSGEAKESKPSAPEADGPSVQVELLGNLIIGLPLDCSQDDASAVHEAMGGRTTPMCVRLNRTHMEGPRTLGRRGIPGVEDRADRLSGAGPGAGRTGQAAVAVKRQPWFACFVGSGFETSQR